MIPDRLSNWSIEAIESLLQAGIHESEEFDFKEMLPAPGDATGKERLRAACCAFANGQGGFLLFGIKDDRSLPPEARLTGVEATLDLPAAFGDYPRLCNPSVYWEFGNPPLRLSDTRVVHIVHIPKSSKAPHAHGSTEAGWRFTKRTNKGTEGMSIEEVRSAFLGLYEKRLRLQLLAAELASLQQSALDAIVPESDRDTKYSLVTFSIQTIESLIADTYPLTARVAPLLPSLQQLRQAVIVANNKTRIFYSTAGLSFSNAELRNREHNNFMDGACRQIVAHATQALALLNELLAD